MERTYYEDELESVSKEIEEETDRISPPRIEKPLLKISDLDKGDPKNELIIIKWFDFLFSGRDIDEVFDILYYYRDLRWISDDVLNRLVSYARGFARGGRSLFSEVQMGAKGYRISRGEEGQEKLKEENKRVQGSGGGAPDVHVRSFVFILQIIRDKIPDEYYQNVIAEAGLEAED